MTASLSTSTHTRRRPRRAFSLVEILLSIFILGIGMIMVASVFPVGANWTRQATEETIGQTVSQNAFGTFEQYFGPIGSNRGDLLSIANKPNPFLLQAVPNFTVIPTNYRAYQFGSMSPLHVNNPSASTYFWTALARVNAQHMVNDSANNNLARSPHYTFDVYILVFRKGDPNQAFDLGPDEDPAGASKLFVGMRDLTNADLTKREFYIPRLQIYDFNKGIYDANSNPAVLGAFPPVGQIGVGLISGTVFRQGFDPLAGKASPRPLLFGQASAANDVTEKIIYVPGPDSIVVNGTALPTGNKSTFNTPLIYVYQTTLTL